MAITLRTEALNKTYTRKIRKTGLGAALRGLFSSEEEKLSAVSELSFSIERGERVGLIGENGAGKSTTLKMLTGILVPTSGNVEVLGLNPWRQRRQLAAQIGVVFGQRPQLLWDIPVQETLSLLRTMYRIPKEVYDVTYREAVERLDLGPLLPVAVRKLSLGQRMRCDLAASLLHAPAISFLDEPTIGLDVSVKEQVREFIREMQRRFESTLLLTTHDLKDITETCDRILLLDRGKLLFDGSLKDLGCARSFGPTRRRSRPSGVLPPSVALSWSSSDRPPTAWSPSSGTSCARSVLSCKRARGTAWSSPTSGRVRRPRSRNAC